jgi:CRISPR-associated protein Cas6
MYWSEDDDTPDPRDDPNGVVDCLFAIECRQLPVDHAYGLASALAVACPWIATEPGIGVHSIHVAGSQNGWERPAQESGNHLQVSRRTRLTLRTPLACAARLLDDLSGTRLQIDDCPLTIGAGKVRPLSGEPTLFARYLAADPDQDEEAFLHATARALEALGIRMRRALCGTAARLATPAGPILTRRLMLAGLSREESLHLQRHGLGPHRLMGCGIFIPHKGIEAVVRTP